MQVQDQYLWFAFQAIKMRRFLTAHTVTYTSTYIIFYSAVLV